MENQQADELDELTALDLMWDGRCFGSMIRDFGGTPLGGYVRFWCGCEWRTNGQLTPCWTHRKDDDGESETTAR